MFLTTPFCQDYMLIGDFCLSNNMTYQIFLCFVQSLVDNKKLKYKISHWKLS